MMLYKLPVNIKTLSPIILSDLSGDSVMTETMDFIPGSTLRGVLAKKYICDYNLGKDAQKDEKFYTFFLSDKLQFLPAYPVADDQVALPLPMTLYISKNGKDTLDILTGGNFGPGYKLAKGYGFVETLANGNAVLRKIGVKKNIELHMARQADKERITGSNQTGTIYNYEAIQPGQVFQGYVCGTLDLLEEFIQVLPLEDNIVYLGRSKHTQYGKCSLTMQAIVPAYTDAGQRKSQNLYIRFISDFIPSNSCFDISKEALKEDLCFAEGVSIGNLYASLSQQEGFVGIWGLKRELRPSLAAGTVVELCKTELWSPEEITALQEQGCQGIGRRTIDGFGQFVIYVPPEVNPSVESYKFRDLTKVEVFSENTRKIIANILLEKITEHLQDVALKDLQERFKHAKPGKHLFARLENVLSELADKVTEDFYCQNINSHEFRLNLLAEDDNQNTVLQQGIKEDINTQSAADRNLSSLVGLNNLTLAEILYQGEEAPYKAVWNEVITEKMQDLADKVGINLPHKNSDKIFYIFWLWYFRMARKELAKERSRE